MDIILITGTIKPLCNIGYDDSRIRCIEYENNLKKYIVKSNFDVIIFAENSGYRFDYSKYYDLANINNKIFEYLDLSNFCSSENISIGDAQIMKNALLKSKYLSNKNSCLWKVSGRIYISNINKILKKHKDINENVFLYSQKYDSIQTWFFKAKIKDLNKYFLSDYTIDKMSSRCIEYAWMDCFKKNKEFIQINNFKCYPDSIGINSSGNPYTMSRFIFFIKNVLLKFNYYKVK